MNLVFVHGWSVTNTDTYGELAQALSLVSNKYNLDIAVSHINLAKYISFHDEVTVDDISKAMDVALRELPGNANNIQQFSCITHSTGGPVVRNWVELFYGSKNLKNCPMQHLVMLAPANHGSTLAALGKKRVGRIKAWFNKVEPGQAVLDWLCVGSEGQWQLNEENLKYNYVANGLYPFVLTGQGIDKKFYDFLNSYLVEPGSDGVVRVAGANMNYRYLSLLQNETVVGKRPKTLELKPRQNAVVRVPKNRVALGVFDNYSHSGEKMGIMRSVVKKSARDERIVDEILRCLAVKTADDYKSRESELSELTASEQLKGEKKGKGRYAMLVLNIHDENGQTFEKDSFDVFLLYGKGYRKSGLPQGFFQDRQLNSKTHNLVYYVDADKMGGGETEEPLFGVKIIARPDAGFSYYCAAEFRSQGYPIEKVIAPNETTYIDITLNRQIDKNVFRLKKSGGKPEDFSKVKPSGKTITD